MANAQKIDEVVDLKKIEGQIDVFENRLRGLQGEFARTTASVIPLNNAIASSKSFKEFEANSQKAAIEIEKLNQLKIKSAILEENLAQKRAKAAQLEDAIVKKKLAAEDAIAAAEKAKIARIAAIEERETNRAKKEAINSELQSKQAEAQRKNYADLSNKATAYGNASSTSSKKSVDGFVASTRAVKVAGTSIESLKEKLIAYKAVAESTQNIATQEKYNLKIQQTEKQISQLSNVGKVGFDSLGNAIKGSTNYASRAFGVVRQLAYILPGVGIAGILAFAVGPIVDYISKLDLFKKKIVENQQNINQINAEANKDAAKQLVNLKLLRQASQDQTLSMKERLAAVKELREEFPKTYKNLSDEIILNGQDKKATDELTNSILQQARARAAKDKIEELSGKVLDIEFKKQKIRNAQSNELSRVRNIRDKVNNTNSDVIFNQSGKTVVSAEINKRAKESLRLEEENKKALESQIAFIEKFIGISALADAVIGDDKKKKPKKEVDTRLKDEQALLREQLEQAKLASREILDSDKVSLQARYDALKVFQSASKRLINLDRDSQLNEENLTADKKAAIRLHAQNQINKIELDGTKETIRINKKAEEELAKLLKDGLKNLQDDGQKRANLEIVASENRLAVIEKNKQDSLVALADQYAQGVISTEKYEKQKFEIEKDATADKLREQLRNVQLVIDIKKAAEIDTTSDEKKAADLSAQIDTDLAAIKIKNAEDVAAKRKELEAKEKEIAEATFSLGVQLIDQGYEGKKNALQADIEASDKRKEKETEEVNNSLASQEEKAKRLEIINARAAAQKEFIERKQRKLDLERARFDKLAQIAKIVGETAYQIINYGGFTPLAIAVATLGAVQLASVIAQPIPKFKDGVKSSKEGLAIVGDGYEHELRINPDGTQELTPNKPTLTYLQAGTEIIGGKDLKQIAAKQTFKEINNVSNRDHDTLKLINAQFEVSKQLQKAFLSRPENKTILTERGLKHIYSNGKGWTEYLRRNN